MGAVVLSYDVWPFAAPARAIAEVIGARLGARVIPLDRRPHLAMYDVVALVVPAAALLDPRIQLFAARGELRGKTVALVTDAPGAWPGACFKGWEALASVAGGARPYHEPLHLGPWSLAGGLPAAARAQAEAWSARLAEVHPPPSYPRGEPGQRNLAR